MSWLAPSQYESLTDLFDEQHLQLNAYQALITFHAPGSGDGSEEWLSTSSTQLTGRWRFLNPTGTDTGLLLFQAEARYEAFGTDDGRFADAVGTNRQVINPIQTPDPEDGFTRLRQLIYKQTLLENQLVLSAGKYNVSSIMDRSRFLGNNLRLFVSAPLGEDFATPEPGDASGAYGRYQPEGVPGWVAVGVFDLDADPRKLDTDIQRLHTAVEFAVLSESWRDTPGSDPDPPPPLIWRNTLKHEPRDGGEPDVFGWTSRLDIALDDRRGLGFRYAWSEEETAGRLEQSAAVGYVSETPTQNSKHGWGVAAFWSRPTEGSRDAGSPRDSYGGEVFARFRVKPGFEVTPTVQHLIDPPFGGSDQTVLGVRVLLAF